MRSPARTMVTLVTAVALTAAACSGDSSGGNTAPADAGADRPTETTTTTIEPFEGDDFYAVPDPLPEGEPGTLIRYETVADVAAGANTWRVMYLSESVAGDPIAVTGTVVVPEGEAPPEGRPTLTIAHGTTGIADECAPSKHPERTELALLADAVADGQLVALTDYEGLGTPGRHPYLVGESEGRGVLDAAKAAAQLPDADAGRSLAIMGYSQGGHGALWAGQLAESWAPDHDLVGVVGGAPATEIPVIISAAGSLPIGGFLFMIFAGYDAAYPELDLSDVLTPAGVEAIAEVDEGCTSEVLGGFADRANDELIQPDAASAEPWATLAAENDPGHVVIDAPVLVLHSAADEVVPAALSDLMVQRMCNEGQVVERRVYDEGEGHGAAAPGALADGLAWLGQIAAGDQPVSTCP